MHLIESFPPIASFNASVLVLGSMPGVMSLNAHQYYAHPRNSFWYIIERLFDAKKDLSYPDRQKILQRNRIALWDVLKACKRKGSLDSSIKNESIVPNDFEAFYSKYQKIKFVFFNGAKAEKEYKKHVLETIQQQYGALEYYRLPSTSPAMSLLNKDEKLLRWKIIRDKTG